ncbi:MAG TPA: lipoyl synthase [Candidatus Bipolaricaulota bacterium]
MAQAPLKPHWFKIRPAAGDDYVQIKRSLHHNGLHTVCQEARCPNLAECWGAGTATFMIMGDVCTRGCRFCAVATGNPKGHLDPLEPYKVAKSLADWGLEYAVITSVDRDDLPDGGSAHFAQTIRQIRLHAPRTGVEVLIPDFRGDRQALQRIVEARPDVVAHNIETVERLSPGVRDVRANYRQSLGVLEAVKEMDGARYTKSSIMLGLGERVDEVRQAMLDLRAAGVDVLTLGQYLRPTRSKRHLDVVQYLPLEQYDAYRRMGQGLGFAYVASGPLVRSSYRAGEFFMKALLNRGGPTHGNQEQAA